MSSYNGRDDREHIACKPKQIYCLALYRKKVSCQWKRVYFFICKGRKSYLFWLAHWTVLKIIGGNMSKKIAWNLQILRFFFLIWLFQRMKLCIVVFPHIMHLSIISLSAPCQNCPYCLCRDTNKIVYGTYWPQVWPLSKSLTYFCCPPTCNLHLKELMHDYVITPAYMILSIQLPLSVAPWHSFEPVMWPSLWRS